jgi:hypothetical protein
MDVEALKIILKLQEENTLLRKAISDAIIRLSTKGKHHSAESDDTDVASLFSLINKIFKDKQQPADSAD